MRLRLVTLTLVTTAAASVPGTAAAQGLFMDVSAGRFVYDEISANVRSNNVIGALRYEGRRDAWIFGAAGAPLGGTDTFWLAAGTGARLPLASSSGRRVSLGADLAAHGFSFRDSVADATGTGGTLEALPVLRLTAGGARVEGSAGWRGHTMSLTGVREHRGVMETALRGSYGDAVRVEGEARWVAASEGTYPFAGAALHVRRSRVGVSVAAGRWLHDDLDEPAWSVGADVSVAPALTLWAGLRQDAPDPLYWNPPRRTWSIGVTTRLRRAAPPFVPVPRTAAGQVLVRLRAADVPAGGVAVAGDFNGWTPQPMTREGDEWVIRLPLAPGVYNYAFRSAAGTWFVPASTPGRRPDGMGGHVAVLVVS